MQHRHALRVADTIQLKYSVRDVYPDIPVTYSDINCKDLRGLITYPITHVGKCGNLVTIKTLDGRNMSISVAFVRKQGTQVST